MGVLFSNTVTMDLHQFLFTVNYIVKLYFIVQNKTYVIYKHTNEEVSLKTVWLNTRR